MIAAAIRARARLIAERYDADALLYAVCGGLGWGCVAIWAECALLVARIAGVAP